MNSNTAHDSTLPDGNGEDGELELVAVGSGQPRPIGAIVSVKFNSESTRLVQTAAAIEGITQAEFVRRAALHAAQKTIASAT